MKLRLQPIRVFCFHQVSDTFDEGSMYRCDWLQTDDFKNKIIDLQDEGYTFISLPDAYKKMQNDVFRCRKYAVLTADDGWESLHNILPWLGERQIPVTLFLNPAYFDGKHYREKKGERYFLQNEIEHLYEKYPLLTIGSHGMEHKDATKLSVEEFSKSLRNSIDLLQKLPNYVPFYAFPYGKYTNKSISIVNSMGVVPVLVSGGKNYNTKKIYLDREPL